MNGIARRDFVLALAGAAAAWPARGARAAGKNASDRPPHTRPLCRR